LLFKYDHVLSNKRGKATSSYKFLIHFSLATLRYHLCAELGWIRWHLTSEAAQEVGTKCFGY